MRGWITMRRRLLWGQRICVPQQQGTRVPFQKESIMGKSQDAKKNVKKEPTKTPKEKKEAKRLKKAERKH
jgi:hypothetical protein